MLARQQSTQTTKPARSGFTLIELMIVLVIISILAALILPAVMRGTDTARIFEVNNEQNKFKASITQFKTVFGVNPPSSVTIHETASAWGAAPRDRRIIKQIWQQFDFTLNRDFNDDLDTTDTITLDGAECLVFFLGGMVDGTSGALRGFSKNPRDPFVVDNGSRDGPFYEFLGGFNVSTKAPTGRLVDTDNDGAPEYVDSLASQLKPYVYFSSYDGAGYRAADNAGRITAPYYKDVAFKVPYNADSFQLISPGRDFEYGTGGHFDPDNPPTSNADSDNITNFHSGILGG